MRLLLFLFLLVSCAGQAQTILGKQVSLTRKTGTTEEFLTDLNAVPGIIISYSSEVIDLTRKVQSDGGEKTLEDYLKSVLKGQPVKYLEQNGKVFLVANEPIKKKFTINGYITDVKSGERLIGTSIYVANKKQGTTSNAYGFFSLTLDEDSLLLVISHSGYISQNVSIDLRQDMDVNFALDQNVVINEIVVVNAESRSDAQNRTLPGRIKVPASLIKSMPSLLGEVDVLKTLQLLPGIQAGNEGTSGLIVRGGSPDQSLILLDGVPVYNASHAFGLFSIFNADAVHNVEVLKGGFPASYGGRLSSVVDVHMKEGDKYKFHGEGGIGLIFSKLTLEGPLKKGKSSFLLSGRRTYADLILKPLIKASDDALTVNTFFADIIGKINFPIGEKDRIYFSFYKGKDKFRTTEEYTDDGNMSDYSYQKYDYGFSWGNITGMARWNHEFSRQLFSNLTFNYSRFSFDATQQDKFQPVNDIYTREFNQDYISSIRDLSIKIDLDYLPSPDHFIKFGISAIRHLYRPGVRHTFQKDTLIRVNESTPNNRIYTGEFDMYAEDDIRLSSKLKANIGVRFTGFTVEKSFFISAQPRINGIYKLTNKWSLKASAVKMNQYIHLLANSNLGLPTDLWVPVTKRIPPQVSYQFSGGIAYNHDKSLEASMEVYYKQLNKVIEYGEGAGFGTTASNWQSVMEVGKGNTYGAEWLFQKSKGKLTGLVSYTLSWSNRKFENLNKGKTFPYKYDRRHEIKTVLIWKPSSRFEFSADWMFATGNAISLPEAWYIDPFTNRLIDIFKGRNTYRLPAYHRLDVAFKFIKQRKRYQRTWVIGAYNAYNRNNTMFVYKYQQYTGVNVYKSTFTKVTLFPILPSISYQFKF
jgi:outer membrane receptor for ferrienterochelin and colicin